MSIVNRKSLAATLNTLQDLDFNGKQLSGFVRDEAEAWLTERHWARGAYRGLYAPTEADFAQPMKLYTGETITATVSKAHILGEEAARAMILLRPQTAKGKQAVAETTAIMHQLATTDELLGIHCCGRCSVSLWRHLLVAGLPDAEEIFASGIGFLREQRDSNGRWNSFSYYYTLLTLLDIQIPAARAELEYARPYIERTLEKPPHPSEASACNREILVRVANSF